MQKKLIVSTEKCLFYVLVFFFISCRFVERKDCDENMIKEIGKYNLKREKHNLITIHIFLINNTLYYREKKSCYTDENHQRTFSITILFYSDC